MPRFKTEFNRFLRIMGPGVITGAADDDPSGIATYTQTGAQFGLGQLWTALFMLPIQTAVQEAVARIGAVTGQGLAAVVKDNYSRQVLYGVVLLVLVANTINIGADLGAMAAAANLIVPQIPFAALALGFTAIILTLEIYLSYKIYANILKWLALALLAYPITVFMVNEPWGEIIRVTFVPHFEFSFAWLFIITGVLGTTISPYMFFWQASEEVEEEREHQLLQRAYDATVGRLKSGDLGWKFIRSMRVDTIIGMFFSEIATWSIIVVGATVLNAHGITDVGTSADAAKALEPLVQTFPNAGFLAKLIFATGIIGLGLLAVPVLSGSASYAIAEAFNWREGLNQKWRRAHGFYGVITVATVIGLLINFIGIDPVKALVVTAVINGVVAVPLLFIIAKIARSDKIMGEYKSKRLSNVLVWFTFIGMGAAAVAMIYTMLSSGH